MKEYPSISILGATDFSFGVFPVAHKNRIENLLVCNYVTNGERKSIVVGKFVPGNVSENVPVFSFCTNFAAQIFSSISYVNPYIMNYSTMRLGYPHFASNVLLTKEGYDLLTHKYLVTYHNLVKSVHLYVEDVDKSRTHSYYEGTGLPSIENEELFMPVSYYDEKYFFHPLEYPSIEPEQLFSYVRNHVHKTENMVKYSDVSWHYEELSKIPGGANSNAYIEFLAQCVDIHMNDLIAKKSPDMVRRTI